MASQPTILYDACVLYPAPLRDLLVQIATSDICKARWTNLIHDEWIRNVLKNRPDLTLEQLTRTRDKMNSHVRGCLVTDFEWLVPSLELPDLDDRHILAAAIACEASQIITFNLRDFPKTILDSYKIVALHPDEFIASLIELKPIAMLHQVETVRKRLLYPPKKFDEYLEILLKQGLPLSVSMLKELQNIQNTM
jgi:hypothetical protein